MSIIQVQEAYKTYRVASKEPGLYANLRHFFRRTYKNIEAVRPLSFTIQPGEIVGFLGPNGAGKTTTLKMLTGLIHPSGGTISVADRIPFRRDKPFLRSITLVMGNKQQLIWDLPASESFAINGAVYNIPEHILKDRIAQLSSMLTIDAQLKTPVRKLSLGERMKCELLAALLHQPQVLFLDEPTLGLDVNAQVAVRNFLRDYNRLHNATILITSHYMADITALCKRVLLIHKGQLFYDGSLDGILDRFAPYREVRLDLSEPLASDRLAPYGEIESVDGQSAKLIVRRELLTTTMERILKDLPVTDLSVSDPSIEKIIGQLFEEGAIKPAAEPVPA